MAQTTVYVTWLKTGKGWIAVYKTKSLAYSKVKLRGTLKAEEKGQIYEQQGWPVIVRQFAKLVYEWRGK